jgi:acyl carrier protein
VKPSGEQLDAYLRRREQVLNKVRHLLIASLELSRDADEIDPDTALFGTGMGLDSVDAVEVVIGLETEFGIRLTDADERRRALRSVNALVDTVMAHPDRRATEGLA